MATQSGEDALTRAMAGLARSPLPLVVAIAVLVAGLAALWLTPREEEPQIVVPVADVHIMAPGLGAAEVERQVATTLEKLLYQVDGVEDVYSASWADRAVVTVRFHVGEDREDSLLKLHDTLQSNIDSIPAAVSQWVVKPVEVDDVPIIVAALWSEPDRDHSDFDLRRLAEEIEIRLEAVPNTGPVEIIGGRPREVRIELDPERLGARQTTPLDVQWALTQSNVRRPVGVIVRNSHHRVVEVGDFVADREELAALVVNVVDGQPVYLRDVAEVLDGPAHPRHYTRIVFGPAHPAHAVTGGKTVRNAPRDAVFLSVAKQRGANAVWVAESVLEELQRMRTDLFPSGVHFQVIRDYGRTADQKVDDLVTSLAVAILSVVVFIGAVLGWRAALVVALAVPICYAATLTLDLAAGYSINRVTLFALILALGLLVDDPITGVDNIERYLRRATMGRLASVLSAMQEVRGALVMSTIAIIVSFTPMFFITGMMGPYMAPMAFNVPVTVVASTAVAFLITPWFALRVLGKPRSVTPPEAATGSSTEPQRSAASRSGYARILGWLLASRTRGGLFLGLIGILFIAACILPATRAVPLKLLPHDNKDEFQVVIDAPEGTSLERTQAAATDIATWLTTLPEVRDVSIFVGTPSPMDFNAMVRQYYLRHAPHTADLRVTLAPRVRRSRQTYEIMLGARAPIDRLAARHQVLAKVVESPPGPPVAATVVAEISGRDTTTYEDLRRAAQSLAERLRREPLVSDVDTSVAHPVSRVRFIADKEKSALAGVSTLDIIRTLDLALGQTIDHLQVPTEAQPLPIRLELPFAHRNDSSALETLYVKGRPGIVKQRTAAGFVDAPAPIVQLGELGRFDQRPDLGPIYHKNLRPVTYVFADTLGRAPAEVVLDVQADRDGESSTKRPLGERTYYANGAGDPWSLDADISVQWAGEGEWEITLRVFRDLGIAFAVALVGIFFVLYLQTGLATLAAIIMLAIPLTVIGIMPGFWLLNGVGERVVAGLPNPVLFTATAMIGMIALAGIVVRNSLVLVDFIHLALARGAGLANALIEAGSTRLRPIVLTAGTTLLGNVVITLDPIFSGLAWAVIFGVLASTVFTLLVVPVVYFLVYADAPGHGRRQPTEVET